MGGDRATAKLEQHARPRRGGRGRRDSVNSRSPRDRGECSGSSSYYRSLPLHPPTLSPPACMHASKNPALLSAHGFHVSIIDDLIRNLLICACGGAFFYYYYFFFINSFNVFSNRRLPRVYKYNSEEKKLQLKQIACSGKNKQTKKTCAPSRKNATITIHFHASVFLFLVFSGGINGGLTDG